MTPEQVKDVYSATYPEITSASIEGPEHKGGKLVYTFRRAVGTKGAYMYPPVKLTGPRLTQLRERGDGFVYVEIRTVSKPKSHTFLNLIHQLKNMVAYGIERLLSVPYHPEEGC
jgi:hypothetical protein